MEERSLFATLIGINAYPQNELYGCIRDVLAIDLLMRDLCKQQGKNALTYKPAYFLAPHKNDKETIAEYKKSLNVKFKSELPTFANITTKAFAHWSNAKAGDICLLYYSGHGSSAEAPEEFWHMKSGRQNETMVLQDSRDRTKTTSRDLMDKEMAYLLWTALAGKDVHCIVIMDCCHSGNNTRAVEKVTYRDLAPSKTKIPFNKYLGYAEGNFYKVKEGKAGISVARYVHLAAAMDTERALETSDGGLFTAKLIDVLRAGGTGKSYRELMRTVSTMVRLRNAQQNPVPFAREDADLNLQFLGNGIIPYKPVFDVQYMNERGNPHWRVYGGAVHGLVASSGNSKTIVSIHGTDIQATVTQVFPHYSILDTNDTAALAIGKMYEASLVQLGKKVLQIGIAENLKKDELEKTFKEGAYVYFDIDFKNNVGADYLIDITNEGTESSYFLAAPGKRLPLFKRTQNIKDFLQSVEAVGKWTHVANMKNADSKIKSGFFEFKAEVLEGVPAKEVDDKAKNWVQKTVKPGDEIVCEYVDNYRPAIKFSIALTGKDAPESYHIGALLVDSKYGISDNYVRQDAGQVHKNKGALNLQMNDKGTFYEVILLEIDKNYKLYNINEITDTIQIFVSNKPIALDVFKQASLELDDRPEELTRGEEERERGTSSRFDDEGTEVKDDWTVFNFRIRIVGPDKKKELVAGHKTEFNGFTIEAPEGFNATAAAITGDDRKNSMQSTQLRGFNEENDRAIATLGPPPGTWGDAESAPAGFDHSLSTNSDNIIEALELTPKNSGDDLVIPEGKELIIAPHQSRLRGISSEDDLEETIIPYGYDEALQLYFPVGYSDRDGNIHVQILPPATSQFLQGEHVQTRSLAGSVKLFFKKILRRKKTDRLVLYQYDVEEGWQEVTDDPEKMQPVLKEKPGSKAILLVHGIIGDTNYMLEALQEIADKSSFLLTFDYENLSTPVSDTASHLNIMLRQAGLYENGMPELVIIAHSMGGLVSRWLLEISNTTSNIKQLLMFGTPNSGSEMASLVKSVFSMLTHALNTSGTIKLAITGLCFLLKKMKLDPKHTLAELKPDSKTILQLSGSAFNKPGLYKIVGGNTALLKNGYKGDDFFLKRLAFAMMNNLVYPGLTYTIFKDEENDLAVTLKSMQHFPPLGAEKNIMITACNHMGYFADENCRRFIVDAIYN